MQELTEDAHVPSQRNASDRRLSMERSRELQFSPPEHVVFTAINLVIRAVPCTAKLFWAVPRTAKEFGRSRVLRSAKIWAVPCTATKFWAVPCTAKLFWAVPCTAEKFGGGPVYCDGSEKGPLYCENFSWRSRVLGFALSF